MQSFFPQDPQEIEAERKRKEEERTKQAEALEFPHRRRNIMMSGMVALSAMMGYAFLSGLVQVEMADSENAHALQDNREQRSQREGPRIENLRVPYHQEEEEEEEELKNNGNSNQNTSESQDNDEDQTENTTGSNDNDNQGKDENAN